VARPLFSQGGAYKPSMICIFRLSDSIVAVITPLVSLMLEKFIQKGITVEFVGEVEDNEQTVFSVLRRKFN